MLSRNGSPTHEPTIQILFADATADPGLRTVAGRPGRLPGTLRTVSETLNNALAVDTQYNWAAMFTAYASGSSLDDISATFACPMSVLRRAATAQDWAAIASRLVAPAPTPPAAPTEARMAVLEANRAKNYQMADMLRDRLIHDFTQLRHGTLRIDKALVSRGQIMHTDAEPGPQDILAMANAAKNVADMTYRALGDVQQDERGNRSSGDATSITVVLPTVVHAPMPEAKVVDVVDLRPKTHTIDEVIAKKQEEKKKQLADKVFDPDDGPPEI